MGGVNMRAIFGSAAKEVRGRRVDDGTSDSDDDGDSDLGTDYSDEDRRGAVQAALDAKHRPKGKKKGAYYFDAPRVHQMFPKHAIVHHGGDGGFREGGRYMKHGVKFSKGAKGELRASVANGTPVKQTWADA